MTEDEITEQIAVRRKLIAKNQRLARPYMKVIRAAKKEKRGLEKDLRKLRLSRQVEQTKQRNEARIEEHREWMKTRVQCSGTALNTGERCQVLAQPGKELCANHDPDYVEMVLVLGQLGGRFWNHEYPKKKIHREGLSPIEWLEKNGEQATRRKWK